MARQVAKFGPYEVDVHSRELKKGGVRVRLQDQPFQILTMLIEHAGDVVTREQIRDRLWPDGTFVDFEHSMNAAIKRLRAALGDTAENPRFVETLHRRGYRFVAAVVPPEVTAFPVQAPIAPSRPRLVVLPFANLGTDTPEYFSDGLTEEMIMQLGRRCADRIGVLARTSSMLYKNVMRAASDIGEALRADYLVEGSVRRDGDRVRITAQLIETKGETHLWANSYDRTMADCLAVQTEVATQIAIALATELIPVPSDGGTGTRHAGAYQAFLRARFNWNKSAAEGLLAAIAGYDESIALDPSYGKAYSGRARARLSLCDYYRVEPRRSLEAARADARRALEIDPGDSEAHLVVGEVERTLEWNWVGAEAAYRAALAANPNNEAAHRYYAFFLAARARPESVVLGDRACALDPLCLVVMSSSGMVHYLRGNYPDAIRRYRQVLGMEPHHVLARRGLAAVLVQLGEYDEAIDLLTSHEKIPQDPVTEAWMGHALAVSGSKAAAEKIARQLLSAQARGFVPAFHLALLYAGIGNRDAAFAQLERACDLRDPFLDTLAVEPRFSVLHGDRRYQNLLERLKLAPLPVA
jgi:TolB-like protein/tetratricopeptide (TPR) repeat protein